MTVFRDRVDVGRQLAERLAFLRDQDVVVLGLPRGGVPVAFEVAAALNAPLDGVVVRKLGVPFQPVCPKPVNPSDCCRAGRAAGLVCWI